MFVNGFRQSLLLIIPPLQPLQNMKNIGIRRKNWVPPLDHLPILHSEGQSPYYLLTFPVERRQAQRLLKFAPFIAQQIVRETQAGVDLLLVLCILGRETVELFHTQALQLWMVVAERTRLWSATAGTGYVVPFRRNYFAGGAGSGVAEDDGKARELGNVDWLRRITCRWEGDARNFEICKMTACAVVLRLR